MADIINSALFNIDTGILIQNACIIIVKTEWNNAIVDELERGCRETLEENKVLHIITITVPGAVEIPFAIKKYWDMHKYKDDKPLSFIALGCVLRGDTPHFEYVCRSVTDGITQLNLTLPVPTIFGVLTVDTHQQAIERIGGIHGHKGKEAAITSLKMISLARSFTT